MVQTLWQSRRSRFTIELSAVRTQRTFEAISEQIRAQVRTGALRAGDRLPNERDLAVTSAKRSKYAPDIPTMKEAGVDGYDEAGSDLWMGVFAPPDPKPVAERLYAEILKSMHAPERRGGASLATMCGR